MSAISSNKADIDITVVMIIVIITIVLFFLLFFGMRTGGTGIVESIRGAIGNITM